MYSIKQRLAALAFTLTMLAAPLTSLLDENVHAQTRDINSGSYYLDFNEDGNSDVKITYGLKSNDLGKDSESTTYTITAKMENLTSDTDYQFYLSLANITCYGNDVSNVIQQYGIREKYHSCYTGPLIHRHGESGKVLASGETFQRTIHLMNAPGGTSTSTVETIWNMGVIDADTDKEFIGGVIANDCFSDGKHTLSVSIAEGGVIGTQRKKTLSRNREERRRAGFVNTQPRLRKVC